jgi:HEAT repeat protein
MRPNLREWLEHLRGLRDSDGGRQYSDYWWGEVLPSFLDACRNSLGEDSKAAREWLDWLRGYARALINPVAGGQAGWQYAWLETILETTILLAEKGQWTSGETDGTIVAAIPRPPCSASPSFPSAFWRELAASLSGRPSFARSRQHVLFPFVLDRGAKPAVLARFHLELLPSGSGEVFLSPKQAPLRCLEEDFSLTFQQAALAARRLLPADCDRGDVRVSIEPFESSDEAYLWNRPLKGPSAGGALALGLWSLWQAVPLDTGLAVSFALAESGSDSPDGACHPVGGDIEKAKGCLQRGLRTLLVAAGQPEELDAWGSELGFTVVRAKTVKQAAEAASGIARQLKVYYEALISRLDNTPWRHTDGSTVTVRNIAIPVQVLMEEKPLYPELEDSERQEGEEEPARRYMDPEIARYYEEPAGEKRKQLVRWDNERGKAQRAVILGAPGGGKSFLAALTAISLAEQGLKSLQEGIPLEELPLPVHLDLTDLAKTLESGNEELQAILLGNIREHSPHDLGPSFWSWLGECLRTGQGWLILDALDQVPQPLRPALHSWLENLENQRWLCHRILTCRTPNYDRSWLPWHQVKEYELAPFEPRDIRRLIERWFEGDTDKASSLKTTLDLSFSLAHACRSPLITTLVCLVHEEQPLAEETRRRDLYNRALRLLLKRGWQDRGESWSESDLDERLWVLEKVAWELFPKRPEVNQFGHREVLQALQQALKVLGLSTAPDQLRNDLLKSGILVEAGLDRRGQARFSFLHRSFLEYLAARALAGRVAEEGWEAIVDLVDRKAWHPAWQEVILFLAGELEDPAPLLELVSDETKDDYFRYRLALAARCLAESALRINESHMASLSDRIARDAFDFWWDNRLRDTDALPIIGALPVVAQVTGHAPNVLSAMGMVSLACDLCRMRGTTDWVRALRALRVAAAVAFADAQVVADLLDLLLDDCSESVRHGAALVLEAASEAISTPAPVVSALCRALTDRSGAVRAAAARALGNMGEKATGDPNIIPVLWNRLSQDPESVVRVRSAMALSRIWGEIDGNTVLHLADIVVTDTDEAVRAAVVRVLTERENVLFSEQVIPVLLDRVTGAKDSSVRAGAARVLGALPGLTTLCSEVVAALVECLSHDNDGMTRARAARALGALRPTKACNLGVVPALLDRVQNDSEKIVRRSCARALRTLADSADRPEVASILIQCVLSDKSAQVRGQAARTLGVMKRASDNSAKVIGVLGRVLKTDNAYVRRGAIAALRMMGEESSSASDVIPVLIASVTATDAAASERGAAALALGSIGRRAACSDIVPVLVDALLRDPSQSVRRYSAWALARLGEVAGDNRNVIPALVEGLLYDSYFLTRRGCALALGSMGESIAHHPEAVQALLDRLLRDEDVHVSSTAGQVLLSRGIRVFMTASGDWQIATVAELSLDAAPPAPTAADLV